MSAANPFEDIAKALHVLADALAAYMPNPCPAKLSESGGENCCVLSVGHDGYHKTKQGFAFFKDWRPVTPLPPVPPPPPVSDAEKKESGSK